MGENNVVFENPYCIVTQESNPIITKMKLTKPDNDGEITFYQLFSGIVLTIININAKSFPVPLGFMTLKKNTIILNYCIKGRTEITLDNNLFTCVAENELCISKNFVVDKYSYPQKIYSGIEIFYDIDNLNNNENSFLKELDIDIVSSLRCYSLGSKPYLATVTPKIEFIMHEILNTEKNENIFKMKLAVIKLLHLISKCNLPETGSKRTYLTLVQVKVVQAVEKIITDDLKENFTVLELAKRFSMGESSLKKYFKIYYGQSITEYLREVRMKKAAQLLADTKLKIIDISTSIGYENQSKFAAVFKKYYEVSPLEYRRLKQIDTE